VDFGGLVSGMEGLLQRTLLETVKIETVINPDLWNPQVDPGQFENALLNLAINARDAMPDGGKLIIGCSNITLNENEDLINFEIDAGEYVVIAVSDTGTGMPAEVLKHVFEPFYTTKEEGKGSGLGLSMVYGFAKQSGGYVSIYSELDQGTTVKIYLRRATVDLDTGIVTAPTDVPRGQGGGRVDRRGCDPDVCALAQTKLTARWSRH
jgi:signal transduction histidine kinase